MAGNILSSAKPCLSRISKPSFRVEAAAVAAAATVDSPPSSSSSVRLPRNTEVTLYQVLRVKNTATQTEIKAAYRALAKQYHPDSASSESDSWDFIDLHRAYTTLSDPLSRARYDRSIGVNCFRYSVGADAARGGPGTEFRPTRRWETDQCW